MSDKSKSPKNDNKQVSPNKINSLYNLDYCLRKAIAIQVIGKRLKGVNDASEKVTEEAFSKAVDISQPYISKWIYKPEIKDGDVDPEDTNKRAPTFAQILQAAKYFGLSEYQMITEAIESDKQSGDDERMLYGKVLERADDLLAGLKENIRTDRTFLYDDTNSENLKRIQKLEKSRYIGFFLENQSTIGHFIMETSGVLKTGSVQALLRVVSEEENPYRCNIVCPMNQKLLYIYLRQDSAQNDRGMIVFDVGFRLQGKFRGGSAVMVSTNRSTETLQVQWAVLVRIDDNDDIRIADKLNERNAPSMLQDWTNRAEEMDLFDQIFMANKAIFDADEIVYPVLKEPYPIPTDENPFINFKELRLRQKNFYEHIYREHLKKIKFAEAWNQSMKELEENF